MIILPLIAAIPEVDQARLTAWVELLQRSDSRAAGTPGAFGAADAVEEELSRLGLAVERRPIAVTNPYGGGRPLLTENLIAALGSGDPQWLLIAHLDSRGAKDPASAGDWKWDRDPAPGADDNASGCAALLELARLLSSVRLSRRIIFVFSGAEEMAAIAPDGFMENLGAERIEEEIEGAVAIDMLLRPRPWGSALRVYSDGRLVSAELAQLVLHASWIEAPSVTIDVRHDPSFTWSDHGSFWARGIGAVLVIEDDFHHARYHTPHDRYGRDDPFYDVEQLADAVRILLRALLWLTSRPAE